MAEDKSKPKTLKSRKLDAKVLIIDDDEGVRAFCRQALHPLVTSVEVVESASAGMMQLSKNSFDIVVTDLQMPEMDGYSVVEQIRSRWASVEIIVMTAFPGEGVVDRLLNLGISYMLVKPISIPQLFYTIMGAWKMAELRRENESLHRVMAENPFGIVGNSEKIRQVTDEMRRVGPLDVPVLIEGESGTGKELVARGIHACSRREKGPFIAVNCAAVSPMLIESELFGHAKGAFTDARTDKTGLIEAADNGTLFLDEIGEMPLELQPKLLRVLDSGEILRVGDTKPRYADVRVIAATNRSLQEQVDASEFRSDLFYRIRGFGITLPPLHQRGADVIGLAEHFLKRYCPAGRKPLKLTPEARNVLMAHPWPGNVRELQNLAAALYAAATGDDVRAQEVMKLLGVRDAGPENEGILTYKEFKDSELARVEADYFRGLLAAFGGNVSRASEAAGMHRANLREKLNRHGLDADEFREQAKGA
ncbi:MAG: sigma-54-dependent Fis family transcriptional regulator [Planctomycetes bacterium]|nr:sigma-54-dependent Fis family transcriptional regulator [Planctomycetota bacterium]